MKKAKNKQNASKEQEVLPVFTPYTWHWYGIPSFCLMALSWVFYHPSLHYNFQFDDIANITKYFYVRNNSFSALFFTGTRWISYWLNSLYYKINKFDPFLYRVGNVTFHTITSVLVFLFLFSVLSRRTQEDFFKKNSYALALCTAFLFLLHPVQTQTVSYVIQGQLEGLAMLFIMAMATCFVYRCFAQGVVKTVLTIALFMLAIVSCGTKEIAILSPLLLVVIDWFFVAQGSMANFRKRLWLHAALSLLVISIYMWFLKPQFFTDIFGLKIVAYNNNGNVITQNPSDAITPYLFFISQFKVILHYLFIFIWPFNMSVEYDWVLAQHFFALDSIVPFFVLCVIAVLILRMLRKNRASVIGFGLIWFFTCILPRTSIIPSPELIVDYKTYIASFGWLFVIASVVVYGMQMLCRNVYVAQRLAHIENAHIASVMLMMLCVPLGLFTVERNKVWRSGDAFWLNVMHNAPNKARAYNNYGVEIAQHQHKYLQAIPYFKKAIAMDKYYPDPRNNLAVAYSSLGRLDDAIAVLEEGISQNHHYPEEYNNLASFLLQKKEYARAENVLKKAIQLRPYYGKAYFNLGRVYLELKNYETAYTFFKKACTEADFDNDMGFTVYGQSCAQLGKYDEAIFAFTKAVEHAPNSPELWLNLGNVYYKSQQYAQARHVYTGIIQKWPNFIQGWFNLGETHYELGDFQEAYGYYKRIEKSRGLLPQLSLRLAGCLEKMGKVDEARQELRTGLTLMERELRTPSGAI